MFQLNCRKSCGSGDHVELAGLRVLERCEPAWAMAFQKVEVRPVAAAAVAAAVLAAMADKKHSLLHPLGGGIITGSSASRSKTTMCAGLLEDWM